MNQEAHIKIREIIEHELSKALECEIWSKSFEWVKINNKDNFALLTGVNNIYIPSTKDQWNHKEKLLWLAIFNSEDRKLKSVTIGKRYLLRKVFCSNASWDFVLCLQQIKKN